MEKQKQQNVLVVGPSAGVGQWIAYYLLQQPNVNLSVIVRDPSKLEQKFQSLIMKFKNIVGLDLEQTARTYEQSNLKPNPFKAHLKDIDILVNAVGGNKTFDEEHTRLIDKVVNEMLVQASKEQKVKKIIYVSSMYITRPNTFVAFMLNTIVGNALAYKMEAENMIRKSGIEYTIVRPGGLQGDKDAKFGDGVQKQEDIYVLQGDRAKGKIQRSTVGKMIAQQLIATNKNVTGKVTFEVIGKPKDMKVEQIVNWFTLEQDTKDSIVVVDHRAGRIAYRNKLVAMVVLIVVALIYMFIQLVSYIFF